MEFKIDDFIQEIEVENEQEAEVARKLFSRTKNQGFVLRQSDYDAKMNSGKAELATAQAELAARQATLNDLMTQNINYRTTAEAVIEAERAELEGQIRMLQAKVERAAALAGYSPEEIEVDTPTPPVKSAPKTPAAPDFDLSTLPTILERLATGSVDLNIDLDDIRETYAELNGGKRLKGEDVKKLLKEYNTDYAKNPSARLFDTADRLYNFSTTLATRQAEAAEAEIARRAEDLFRKRIAAEGIPMPSPPNSGSILLRNRASKPGTIDPERGVKRAMEALTKRSTEQR